ncbi:MAG TPA: hypothetical protein PLH45_08810, partial [Synergistales bacterium]|nr:hypothetical protein [Synergistales bacterium]
RQMDLRREYSATIMTKAFAFYSYLTSTKLPGQILSEMRGIAMEALEASIERYRENTGSFAAMGGSTSKPRDWEPTVVSFEELSDMAEKALGDGYARFVDETIGSAPEGSDERVRAALLVESMVELCGIPGPMAVIGFLPPWYPHRSNQGETRGDKVVADAASAAAGEMERRFGLPLDIRPFFEGVSDLSYCGFQGDSSEMEAFARNMPGWGRPYRIPTEALAELDIPILNLGTVGKDAHKNTERIHLPFMLEIFPNILRFVVERIIEGYRA